MKNKPQPIPRPRTAREEALAALATESDLQLGDLIRRPALPLANRTHFLRVRLPGGGSCL